jgi:hypothetical protein
MSEVMIDLETFGLGADAVIMSIGAVKFDLAKGVIEDSAFYASVSIDSNLELGRSISESTVIWWMEQAAEAQAVFKEEKIHLREALEQFTEWLGHSKHNVWGNGPAFDLGKIAHAYKQCGWDHPWEFYNERCVRTYRSLPGAKAIPKVTPAVAHHGMHDAYAQAQHIINIYQALFGGAHTAKPAKSSMVKAHG